MRRSKSMRPTVEGLESLVFLSVAANPAMAAREALIARQQAAMVAKPTMDVSNPDLSGTMRGNYRLVVSTDGSSGTFSLQGVGPVRGLGPARINATYEATESSAPEVIMMTLASRKGSMTLQVGRAPGDVDPDDSTARLRYQVVSGTGAYTQSTGTGVIDMTLRPQLRSLGVTGQLSVTLRPETA